MVIKYNFDTELLEEDLERGEEYWASQDYGFEIDLEDEKKVATAILVEEQGFNKKTAQKVVEDVLWNYDLLDKFLDKEEDFVKDYFEERAKKEFWESMED